MNKVDMILNSIEEQFSDVTIGSRYYGLYSNFTKNHGSVFGFMHGYFDFLFKYMDDRFRAKNFYYTAHESRELIKLIGQLDELQIELKKAGEVVWLDYDYYTHITQVKQFLESSGGSQIPETFSPLGLKKYEAVFEIVSKGIKTSQPVFESLTLIGEGSYAIVQKYKDSFYDKHFAVKQAKASLNTNDLGRFKREFQTLSKLNFPYILDVYTYDYLNNRYTMEYCEATLHKFISERNNSLKFETRKRLALQMVYGLNYIHKKGYFHRDVSYYNILIKKYEFNAFTLKLSDFGLVKDLELDITKSDSSIKGIIRDPTLASFREYSIINEIYSIGIVLLFIFTGKKSLKPTRTPIDPIVHKCTDVNTLQRYQNLAQLIADLELLQPF